MLETVTPCTTKVVNFHRFVDIISTVVAVEYLSTVNTASSPPFTCKRSQYLTVVGVANNDKWMLLSCQENNRANKVRTRPLLSLRTIGFDRNVCARARRLYRITVKLNNDIINVGTQFVFLLAYQSFLRGSRLNGNK